MKKTRQVSVTEYALKEGITRQGVHNRIAKGLVKAKKVGNTYVIEIEETEEK